MKTKNVWMVLFIAIITLLVFQTIWLYNTYNMKKVDLNNLINTGLSKAIEKEVVLRSNKHIEDEEFIYDPQINLSNYSEKLIIDNEDVLEAGIFQQVLNFMGYPFNINTLDSIFQDELQKAKLPAKHLLTYKDSTGTILEQTGNLPKKKIDKAFHTESLLIVDGKRVQAIVDIKPSVVIKQMAGLLIASFLMLIIIAFCVVYQTKTVFTQLHLNKLRRDFTNALTHDMKTPLGSINIVLSNFRSGIWDNKPEKREYYGKIGMDQVANLLAIIDKILTIARLEKNNLILDIAKADIHTIIRELKERFSVSDQDEKQVVIQTSIDINEDDDIYIDETLIKNAIANLIENAIKYSGETVKIKIDCFILNDNQLFIRVTDNGSGVSDENKEKIFELFERGAATGKKGARGFGIGLNYVKRVSEAHGGIVSLYSNKGEGCEFTIILPLSKPNEDNL